MPVPATVFALAADPVAGCCGQLTGKLILTARVRLVSAGQPPPSTCVPLDEPPDPLEPLEPPELELLEPLGPPELDDPLDPVEPLELLEPPELLPLEPPPLELLDPLFPPELLELLLPFPFPLGTCESLDPQATATKATAAGVDHLESTATRPQ